MPKLRLLLPPLPGLRADGGRRVAMVVELGGNEIIIRRESRHD